MNVVIFDLDDTLFSRTDQIPEDYTEKDIEGITLFPGAKKVVSSKNYISLLLTRGDNILQSKKLKVLGIDKDFKEIYIVGGGEGAKRETIRKIAEKYKNSELFIVGDRIREEIRYGNELNFTTIQMVHGKRAHLKPRSKNEKPKFKITDIREVLKIVK